MKKITIKINSEFTPEAPLRILTEGFEGVTCFEEMKNLQFALHGLGIELSLKKLEKMLESKILTEQNVNRSQENCG